MWWNRWLSIKSIGVGNVWWAQTLAVSPHPASSAVPRQFSECCCAVFRSQPAVGWLWETRWRKLWWCEASSPSAAPCTGCRMGKCVSILLWRRLTNDAYADTWPFLLLYAVHTLVAGYTVYTDIYKTHYIFSWIYICIYYYEMYSVVLNLIYINYR